MKEIVKTFIEMALRQVLQDRCPNYPTKLKENFVWASMMDNGLKVSKNTLYLAIELAAHSHDKELARAYEALDYARLRAETYYDLLDTTPQESAERIMKEGA